MKKIFLIALTICLLFPSALLANTVKLAWDRNAETDVTGYNVYRSTTTGTGYAKINAALVPQPSTGVVPAYTDSTPTNAKYFYVVRAVNQAGLESGNSNEVVANPLAPNAPTNLNITGLTTASLVIRGLEVATAPIGSDGISYTLLVPRVQPPRDSLWPIKINFR